MSFKNLICQAINSFSPVFRFEVQQMKQAMLSHAKRLETGQIENSDDEEIYNYFYCLYEKGYSRTYIAAIVATASSELERLNQSI